MKLDSAVTKLLGLGEAKTSVSSHGGGMSSASTAKISTTSPDGASKKYFMKSGIGEEAKVMLEGEHNSLNAIHSVVSTLCPASLGWGQFSESPSKYFLVTEFLDLSSRRTSSSSSTQSLAAKLGKLHTTPAPVPEGYNKPMFGFPVTTCCGDTPQRNSYKESWAEFFAENRLRFILEESEKNNGPDKELRDLITTTIDKVVPRLIGDKHLNGGKGVLPVVVHGDLWSGNASRGKSGSEDAETEDLTFDPSSAYCHNEYEIGIMMMFGGFGSAFFKEYHQICPKTEPVEEYEDRVALYELYHHLNHHAMFSGGYKGGAVSMMKNLIKKYGRDRDQL